ncbi:hypothetical protein XA68_15121 [Ophiocordyceps unilateralis]|uniref:Mid2 domain-containing protein n=1 Tax=Ophiocordyceps unilateralis TaxID=268505 RepID=A0A2A9P997_OPHUN|nr:hypothetical protein XA68_15121 [Ophiocordyceps unilateralis]
MRRPGLGLITTLTAAVSASPHRSLLPRGHGCDGGGSPCGTDGQFCCGAGQTCTTMAGNVATCVGSGAGGLYGAYTTTWTETRTFTSTVMTHWAPAPEPTAGVDCVPAAPDQQACGSICCAGWQTCAFRGQCSVKAGFVEPTPFVVTADGGQVTTQYSAPFRVTGTTTVTTSGLVGPSSASASASSAAAEAIGADAGTAGSGLGPGAIAGIVIGTIAGVALLLLLCFCCIARGLWAAICGRRRNDRPRDRVDVYEEHRSRHTHSRAPSAAHAVRKDRHSGWFGGPSRPTSVVERREKRSGGNRWLGVAGAAGTILALLNLKKDKPKPKPPRKGVSSRDSYSYYDYSDLTSHTSPGSSSSGRRSNYTRRTGDSRLPGPSHYSRTSRRP